MLLALFDIQFRRTGRLLCCLFLVLPVHHGHPSGHIRRRLLHLPTRHGSDEDRKSQEIPK